MDFVFMLTRGDCTIDDGLDVLDEIAPLGLGHIGFKDVGIDPGPRAELHRAIKELGATSYLELVSTNPESIPHSARAAVELGVDYLLGSTAIDVVMPILAGSGVRYLPFPGVPIGHPTQLGGAPDDIARDCRRFCELGAAGVDLLAYRAMHADPIELVRAARKACSGRLLVAGGVVLPKQIHALAAEGVDAFTIGSAIFDGSFAPQRGRLRNRVKAVLDVLT